MSNDMDFFYSPSVNGFYPGNPYGNVGDEVQISEATYRELLEGQAKGAVIAADEHGRPALTWPTPDKPVEQQQDIEP